MIPYNTPEERQQHTTYINYLGQWITHCWSYIPASPDMDADLWVRQAYMRNDFIGSEIHSMLHEYVHAGAIWACCELYIYLFSQSCDEDVSQSFYNLTGDDITNYICPYA